MEFDFIQIEGKKLNPKNFGGREPSYEEIYELYKIGSIKINIKRYVSINIQYVIDNISKKVKQTEVIWISKTTFERAKNVLNYSGKIYYKGREGVSFDVARGAWKVVTQPQQIKCPPGYKSKCFVIQTKLSKELNMDPFIIESDFLFKGISGKNIQKGWIDKYTYLILPYNKKEGRFLTWEELQSTLLYKNYLSNKEVQKIIKKSSRHMKKEWWHVERMNKNVLALKVVWRDVAKEFMPAPDLERAIPDHNAHYITVESMNEAFYLVAVLLAPQINAVVRELSPWIGHVQPRFLRYFRIPKYNPKNIIHIKLAYIGRRIYNKRKCSQSDINEIEKLVDRL